MQTTSEDERPGEKRDVLDNVTGNLLEDVARAVLARAAARTGGATEACAAPGGEERQGSSGERIAPGWLLRRGRPWTYLAPVDETSRDQGWKLHVSATALSAPMVLAAVTEVLARRRCAFKFAATLGELDGLISRNQSRGAVGKFITVYPPDDEAAVAIAEELHQATFGLPGPPILSDRAYRPGSLVHYRFGVFSAPSYLGNDGGYESRLTAPDGTRVTDERNGWYSPPSWAVCPFESGKAPVRTAAPAAVLLGDRFAVRQALKHGSKGGVFLAEDRVEGGDAVIKQARPHLDSMRDGRDGRDLLRHEARMLEIFGPLGVTARKLALFETNGNLFLAQEHLAGSSLSGWAGEQRLLRPEPQWREAVVSLARRLVDLVSTVHDQGYVLRDLTPNNVIVTPEDDCLLIDLEMAVVPGTPTGRVFTPGYAPPEQARFAYYAPALGVEADLFALGATFFFLMTGSQPALLEDEPAERSWESRLSTLWSVVAAGNAVATAMTPLILGLMREDPALRWDLPRVRTFLEEMAAAPISPPAPDLAPLPAAGPRPGVAEWDRLLWDGIAYTLRTMLPSAVANPAPHGHLWPIVGFGVTVDPCSVQYGSAGVLTLLASAAESATATSARGGRVEPPAPSRADLVAGLRDAAGWTVRRMSGEHRPSPGLYFGRAGIAWSLYEAGHALGDEPLRAEGIDLALGLPTDWPNPDVCHGLAGTGLALLHFWHRTGDTRFRDRAGECADTLLKVAQRTPEAVLWPIPADFDSTLAGVLHYGFGHGVAGIGAFLLATGIALGREDCLETATAAGETLLDLAEQRGDAIWWRGGPEGTSMMPHWCSGSSGVGTFLVRLYAATGDTRFREAAEGAAVAVRASLLNSGTSACHGLAGDGQFLLDMADLLDEPAYREQAGELAGYLCARAMLRDGLLVVADESGTQVSMGWNTGLAGVLDFLHRLRHGGPRSWMAEVGDSDRAPVGGS
ncbi:class IV lanthionine synthetase LanL [Streptosporangium sp. NPDC002607]